MPCVGGFNSSNGLATGMKFGDIVLCHSLNSGVKMKGIAELF